MSEDGSLDTLKGGGVDGGYLSGVSGQGDLFDPVEHLLLDFEEDAATVVLKGDAIASH